MATDEPSNNGIAGAEEQRAGEPPAPGIVSVNDRGRKQGGRAGPFLMMGVIVLVVLIGGILTINVVKAKLSGPKRSPTASSATTAGLARNFASESAPPLPGGTSASVGAVASAPACPDGSAGNELRGQDGVVVRNASGQSVRVCPNGQVIGISPAPAAAQPIPVSRTVGGYPLTLFARTSSLISEENQSHLCAANFQTNACPLGTPKAS